MTRSTFVRPVRGKSDLSQIVGVKFWRFPGRKMPATWKDGVALYIVEAFGPLTRRKRQIMRPHRNGCGGMHEVICPQWRPQPDGVVIIADRRPDCVGHPVDRQSVDQGFEWPDSEDVTVAVCPRSEERRVGKECRSRGSPEH